MRLYYEHLGNMSELAGVDLRSDGLIAVSVDKAKVLSILFRGFHCSIIAGYLLF